MRIPSKVNVSRYFWHLEHEREQIFAINMKIFHANKLSVQNRTPVTKFIFFSMRRRLS